MCNLPSNVALLAFASFRQTMFTTLHSTVHYPFVSLLTRALANEEQRTGQSEMNKIIENKQFAAKEISMRMSGAKNCYCPTEMGSVFRSLSSHNWPPELELIIPFCPLFANDLFSKKSIQSSHRCSVSPRAALRCVSASAPPRWNYFQLMEYSAGVWPGRPHSHTHPTA